MHKLKKAEVADSKDDPDLSAHGTEKPPILTDFRGFQKMSGEVIFETFYYLPE